MSHWADEMTENRMPQLEIPSQEQVDRYRCDGFVHIPGVLNDEDVARFAAAARAVQDLQSNSVASDATFTHIMQLWKQDDTLRELTLNSRIASLATALAGVPLRLYHDHLMIKEPHNGAATEFHQDQPYWPHLESRHALSAWVALVDVPVERGCMTFIPGSHELVGRYQQDLRDADNLMSAAPELVWRPRVTVPLRAGDCTFHHSLIAHTAGPNATDEARIAHVIVYMDVQTRFDPRRRPVGVPLDETLPPVPGIPFPDDEYPPLP